MIETWLLALTRYRACFETIDPLILYDYPGSAWRGAFGHALKETACTTPGMACAHCPERRDCPYPPLFEPLSGAEAARPYVFEPHATTGVFPPGAPLALDMVVMGWLNVWLPLLIDSLILLGETGLGVREPVRLRLTDLRQQTDPAENDWVSLSRPDGLVSTKGRDLGALPPLVIPPAPERARVELLTPLRLKFRGELVRPEAFTARDLLIAISRRCEACALLLEDLPLPPGPDDWLADADTLIERKRLHWRDTFHYSSRQREALKLGGLLGSLWLRGPVLARIWPWLWAGQWLHLGSSVTVGLGHYVVRAR